MNGEIFFTAVIAGLIALLIPFILRPILGHLGVLDVPNHRSSHNQPVLRGGGVAPLLGLILGGLVYLVLAYDSYNAFYLLIALSLSSLMAFVGLVEDVRGIPVKMRASLQLLAGVILGSVAVLASNLNIIWILLIAIVFAYHVNLTNFMDGINGISAGHGAAAGIGLALLGHINSLPWLSVLGLMLALVFIAFIPWNFFPPGMFLGDVGSYLLGGAVGALGIFAITQGVHPLAVFSMVSIYWIDASTTLVRRFLKGEPIFQAHRSHIYQQLVDQGFSHLGVSALITVCSVFSTAAGVAVDSNLISSLTGSFFILLIAVFYLSLPKAVRFRKLGKRKEEVPPYDLPLPVEPRNEWAPQTWAVFGAGGFVGSSVVKYLQEKGYEVVQIPAPRLQTPVSKLSIDDLIACAQEVDTTELEESLLGVDVIINAAGVATPTGSADGSLYGANALLPSVIALTSERARIPRMIHLSSAAVQGSTKVLNATPEVNPFSPYSDSKALGEQALLKLRNEATSTDLLIIRATSVQGVERPTTRNLKRIAQSPLASVAAPGTQPTVISSIDRLVEFIHMVGKNSSEMEVILLQPWEGMSVREVLEIAGGKPPVILPQWLCRGFLSIGRVLAYFAPRFSGVVRRLELMWFGQGQESGRHSFPDSFDSESLKLILRTDNRTTDH